MKEAPFRLDDLVLETPCDEPWSGMRGDDRVRRCDACRLDVHDLSKLTRDEAESLVRGADGRLCVRLHRRPDGRVLTQDCRPARRKLGRVRTQARVALAGLLAIFGVTGCGVPRNDVVTMGVIACPEFERDPDQAAPGDSQAPPPVRVEPSADAGDAGS